MDDPEEMTTADVNDWLEGADEDQFQFTTDDEMIADVLDNSEDEEKDEGGASSSAPAATHTVNTDSALRAYAPAITWAEENGASASQILTHKTLHKNVLKVSFNTQNKKTIPNYFTAV